MISMQIAAWSQLYDVSAKHRLRGAHALVKFGHLIETDGFHVKQGAWATDCNWTKLLSNELTTPVIASEMQCARNEPHLSQTLKN